MICMHGTDIDLDVDGPLGRNQCTNAMRRFLVNVDNPDQQTLRVLGDFFKRLLVATEEE